MKTILISLISLLSAYSFVAKADLPYINNNTAEERTRVQNGDITCEVSKPKSTINAGVYGSNEDNRYYGRENDKGGYIGISIPIGGSSSVDCNKLYELSVKEKELKILHMVKPIFKAKSKSLAAINTEINQGRFRKLERPFLLSVPLL